MQLLPHHPVNGQGLVNWLRNGPIALGWATLPRNLVQLDISFKDKFSPEIKFN